jgi:hypothetical protein
MRRLILENEITPFYKRVLKLLNKKLGEGEDASVVWDILSNELSIDDTDSKIEILHLYTNHYDELGKYDNLTDADLEGVDDTSSYDNELVALSMFLDIPPILIEEDGSHYGLNTYKDLTTDEVYAVGDDDEVSEAMEQYFDGYVDNVGGIDNIDRYTVDDFIELDQYSVDQYVEETADYRLDDMTEEDVISEAGYDSREEYEDRLSILEERIDELNNLLEEKESELEERIDDDEDFFGTDEYEELKDEINDLEIELSDKQADYEGLGDELRELFDTAREELRERMVSDITSEIDSDGVDYFINNLGLSFREAVDYYCTFDESGLERYLAENEDRGNTLSGYDGSENEEYYNGVTYYIYRTD